jgi:hypothetical protein
LISHNLLGGFLPACALLALLQRAWAGYYAGMMRRLKPLFMSWLCLALAVSSVTLATAQAQSAALYGSREIVICAGYGTTTITLDANGNPVGPVHLCPDCLAGLVSYLPPNLPALTLLLHGAKRIALPFTALTLTSHQTVANPARGPPALL